MDPHHFGKLDRVPRPDPHQSEKQYPDPHQGDADLQHCKKGKPRVSEPASYGFLTTKLSTLTFSNFLEVLRLSSERYFICVALFERALRDYDKLRKREAFIDQFRKVRKENRHL